MVFNDPESEDRLVVAAFRLLAGIIGAGIAYDYMVSNLPVEEL